MDVKFGLITAAILMSLASTACSSGGEENFTFGGCEPGKETCRDCYLTLVKSLLGNGGNVFNLTNAFFPPNLNPPDVVIVTYNFRNESTDRQYISLVLGYHFRLFPISNAIFSISFTPIWEA